MEFEAAEELLHATFALLRGFGRQFRREREPLNITPTQFHALCLVSQEGTLTPMDAAERLHVAGPTATRAIEALVHKGLLIKDRDPQDRRMVWLRLSDPGEILLDHERAQHIRYFQQLTSELSSEEQKRLLDLMKKLAQAALLAH